LSYALAQVRNAAALASEADTESYQVMVGRALTHTSIANAPPDWTLNVKLTTGLQRQHLLAGGDCSTTNYSIAFAGQRAAWGTLNLVFTGGEITQSTGGAPLRQRGLQFDAAHQFSERTEIKLYSRDTRRNIGNPLSGAVERVTGLQLTYKL
jgi:hypothetical protein